MNQYRHYQCENAEEYLAASLKGEEEFPPSVGQHYRGTGEGEKGPSNYGEHTRNPVVHMNERRGSLLPSSLALAKRMKIRGNVPPETVSTLYAEFFILKGLGAIVSSIRWTWVLK